MRKKHRAMQRDETRDAKCKSWIEAADAPECEFPIQNLPLEVFRRSGAHACCPRAGFVSIDSGEAFRLVIPAPKP